MDSGQKQKLYKRSFRHYPSFGRRKASIGAQRKRKCSVERWFPPNLFTPALARKFDSWGALGNSSGDRRKTDQYRKGLDKNTTVAGHHTRLGIPSENITFEKTFKERIDDWAKREGVESEGKSRVEELRRDFIADEIEKCITKLQSHKAAGGRWDRTRINEPRSKGMVEMMVLPLYKSVRKNEYASSNWS